MASFFPRPQSAVVDTSPNVAELQQLEQDIETGLASFHRAGVALTAIRDRKLYVPAYASFEEYAEKRWRMSYTHVSRLIAAADVVRTLVEAGAVRLPATESQARALTKVPKDKQPAVWSVVTGELPEDAVTAEAIAEIADRVAPRKKRARRKAPKAIKLKGKGWQVTIERKLADTDPVSVLEAAISMLEAQQSKAA